MKKRIDPEPGRRLRTLRDKKGLSRTALGALTKVFHSTIQKYEEGERAIPLSFLKKVAPALDADPEDFLRAIGGELHATVEDVRGHQFARLPLFDIRASAGRGSLAQDGEPIGFRLFDHNWLKSVTRSPLGQLAVIQVDGDSMEVTLHTGDHVLVDLGRKALAQPGMFVLELQGELVVKRVSMDFSAQTVTLVSDNTKYPPQQIADVDRLNVVGRVIWVGRSV